MVGLLDLGTIQAIAVWLSVAAAVGGLVNLLLGLFSLVTGREAWPNLMRRLRRRRPASQEDQRRLGMALALNGAGVLIVIMGVSINTFAIGGPTLGEPLRALRFVLTVVGMAGAMACFGGAYRLSLTVRYAYGKLSAGAPPAEPSI